MKLMAALLLIPLCLCPSLCAQTFVGTFTGQGIGGEARLILQSNGASSYSGTYTEVRTTWQVQATLQGGTLSGKGLLTGSDFRFTLAWQGSSVLLSLVEMGPSGAPEPSTARQVLLAPTGVTPGGGTPEPPPTGTPLVGDVNADGKVSIVDVVQALRLVAGLPATGTVDKTAADLDADGKVTVKDVVQLLRQVAGLVPGGNQEPAGAVERATVSNPLSGFSIRLPVDWLMSTTRAYSTEIAIDSTSGASLRDQPALWFFHSPMAPAQEAVGLTTALRALAMGPEPTLRATGNQDEWEVSMTSNGARGPLTERWLCRRENGVDYVIGSMVRPAAAAQFKTDLDVALSSCRLTAPVTSTRFKEPTENAYSVRIPDGWRWVAEESRIYRSEQNSGYFVWKAQSLDGLTGCFSGQPWLFNLLVPYATAEQCASTLVLDGLKQQMPDARLDSVRTLTRAGDWFTQGLRLLGFDQGRVDYVVANYLATRNGFPVRIRVSLVTIKWGYDWNLTTSGSWAPVATFDAGYALGNSVLASLRTDPVWRQNQLNADKDVSDRKLTAIEEAAAAWDAYIRE
ncbi:MAG TPA: dockerin type I repeat-containing protein [Armatimonadota bacterium]|jgi:hypothetical protein